MTDCRSARRFIERRFDGSLPIEDEFALERHVEQCERCAREYRSMRRLHELLHTAPAPALERLDVERALGGILERLGGALAHAAETERDGGETEPSPAARSSRPTSSTHAEQPSAGASVQRSRIETDAGRTSSHGLLDPSPLETDESIPVAGHERSSATRSTTRSRASRRSMRRSAIRVSIALAAVALGWLSLRGWGGDESVGIDSLDEGAVAVAEASRARAAHGQAGEVAALEARGAGGSLGASDTIESLDTNESRVASEAPVATEFTGVDELTDASESAGAGEFRVANEPHGASRPDGANGMLVAGDSATRRRDAHVEAEGTSASATTSANDQALATPGSAPALDPIRVPARSGQAERARLTRARDTLRLVLLAAAEGCQPRFDPVDPLAPLDLFCDEVGRGARALRSEGWPLDSLLIAIGEDEPGSLARAALEQGAPNGGPTGAASLDAVRARLLALRALARFGASRGELCLGRVLAGCTTDESDAVALACALALFDRGAPRAVELVWDARFAEPLLLRLERAPGGALASGDGARRWIERALALDSRVSGRLEHSIDDGLRATIERRLSCALADSGREGREAVWERLVARAEQSNEPRESAGSSARRAVPVVSPNHGPRGVDDGRARLERALFARPGVRAELRDRLASSASRRPSDAEELVLARAIAAIVPPEGLAWCLLRVPLTGAEDEIVRAFAAYPVGDALSALVAASDRGQLDDKDVAAALHGLVVARPVELRDVLEGWRKDGILATRLEHDDARGGQLEGPATRSRLEREGRERRRGGSALALATSPAAPRDPIAAKRLVLEQLSLGDEPAAVPSILQLAADPSLRLNERERALLVLDELGRPEHLDDLRAAFGEWVPREPDLAACALQLVVRIGGLEAATPILAAFEPGLRARLSRTLESTDARNAAAQRIRLTKELRRAFASATGPFPEILR